jgi:hypothetical protein
MVFTKIGSDVDTFIDRLADASRVTIVGITHYHLADYLEEALARKLQRNRAPFWVDIKVVFLHESMLHAVRDELGREFAHERDALARRRKMAKQGSSAVQRFFLRSDHHNAWQLLEYEAMLPFVGTYFEQSAGEQLVQIAMSRPGFATKDYLFLEFSSLTAPIELNCYADTFAEIVRGGKRSEEIILTGDPVRNGPFRLRKAVPRRSDRGGPRRARLTVRRRPVFLRSSGPGCRLVCRRVGRRGSRPRRRPSSRRPRSRSARRANCSCR